VLRQKISRSIKNVINAFDESATLLILENMVTSRDKDSTNEKTLSSFQHLMHLSKSFGKAEWEIISIFNIDALFNISFWSSLITNEDIHSTGILDSLRRLNFMSEHLPKMMKLLERDVDILKEKLTTKNVENSGNRKGLLTIILAEEIEYSSSSRLVLALESIKGLYDALSIIENVDNIQLSVISCDSGSDKSFDFLGAAKSIEAVKEIILGLWDKVIFYKEDKTNKKLELISAEFV
jgi:hypothetical protein